MKRILTIVLCLTMVLGILAGCGGSGSEATGGSTNDQQAFSVGYGKADISPETSVYLCGYGDPREERMSTGVAEHLFANVVAFSDTKGQTMIVISTDLLLSIKSVIDPLRKNISNETGVPFDYIMFHCTHNHSGPEMIDPAYKILLYERVIQACKDAMADRKPAQMFTTFTRPEGYNTVRHYLKADGNWQGEEVGAVAKDQLIGHYGKADNLLQLVKFTREGSKDIVMINWQGHPRGTAPNSHTTATCNYAGVMRTTVEEGLNCESIFILSGSGNVNNNSQIPGEVKPENYMVLGKELGQEAIDASASFQPAQLGDILTAKTAIDKAAAETTLGAPLYAFSIGDLAFAFAPFEIFDTNAMFVKENSKYPMTFYASCSNESHSYLPTPPSWTWEKHYEVRITNYPKGTAEKVADYLVGLLDKTFAEGGYTEQPKKDGYITPEFVPVTDGVEYLNPAAGDVSQAKEVANGFWRFTLLNGSKFRIFLAKDEATAKKVMEQTTVKLLFNEQSVVVGIVE